TFYNLPPRIVASFGLPSGQPVPGHVRARQDVTLWQEQSLSLIFQIARGQFIASWSLSEHHFYDPLGRVLYQGDGTRRSATAVAATVITTVAGTGVPGYSGDGGQATQARLNGPATVITAADGSIYIADTSNHCIRRVTPDGLITRIAGLC